MSDNPWHKRYHDDALGGYMALTLEERGAYTTLLDLMYQRGEAILDNERMIAGWMQCSIRKYRAMRDRLIDLGKITRLDDDRLTNSRFEKERENRLKTSRENAENGTKGGRKSAETRKNVNENNDADKRPLKPGSSHTRSSEAQTPERKIEDDDQTLAEASEGEPPSQGSGEHLRLVHDGDREYAFVAGKIRLNEADFENWRKSFPNIDLRAELWGLSEWAGQQKSWFNAVSGALAKRNREAGKSLAEIRERASASAALALKKPEPW